LLKRIGPNAAQRVNWGIDYCAPLVFDAERVVKFHFANLARAYTILSRSCENGGERSQRPKPPEFLSETDGADPDVSGDA